MKNLIDNPPSGYEFIVNDNKEKKSQIDSLKKYRIIKYLYKNIFKKTFNVFNLINKIYYALSPKDADIVLSTGVVVNEKKPWIMKILDTPFGMAGNDYDVFIKNKEEIEKALSSEYCKRIIVHTERAKEHMKNYFSKNVTDKIIKLNPAIPGKITERKDRDDKNVNFLFMGSINNPDEFFMRGGLEALETFKILCGKHKNINLNVRCKVPEDVKEDYKADNINFLENSMEYEEIKKLYQKSDVLIMPGYGGYFIMSYLEAFSYGLPIVALDTYGCDEFIIGGKTGFTVKPSEKVPINDPSYPANTRSNNFIKSIEEKYPEVINALVEKCSILIDDQKLRKKMSKDCQIAFQTKYSFDKKIENLKDIFDDALDMR